MSIALLKAISALDLPLCLDDVNEVLGMRSLIDGGLIVGYVGVIDFLPCGRPVVLRPAVIRDITPLGVRYLGTPDTLIDPFGDML